MSNHGLGGGGQGVQGLPGPVLCIWAEENSALGAGLAEWAFGNGASTPQDQGVVIPFDGELFATGLSLRQGTATVGVHINGAEVARVSHMDAQGSVKRCLRTLGAPVAVTAGQVVGFKTIAASGTTGPNTVMAYIRHI